MSINSAVWDLVFNVGFSPQSVTHATNWLKEQVKNVKVDFNLPIPVGTDVVMEELAGKYNVEQLKTIQNIQMKIVEYTDKNRVKTQEVVSAMVTFKDKAGAIRTEMALTASDLEFIQKTYGHMGEVKVGPSFNLPIAKGMDEGIASYVNMRKQVQETGNEVDKFLKKAEGMSGKPVDAAKKAALAVKGYQQAFEDAFNADQTDRLAPLKVALDNAKKDFDDLNEKTKASAGFLRGWAESLGNAIKQTISYSFSIGMVRGAQQLLSDSIKYTIDLSKEMVKIQVLGISGANSQEEINKLAFTYNELARTMGVTTLEVAKGSVEWLRQGKTIAETTKLMESTMMLSKLGAIEAGQATEYLTAITSAFKIEALDTAMVVDKLIAVDNIAATSAGELATALRYTSVSAQEAGVSMDQLISYVATVSSVTRNTPETIGQAFKTMFARMTTLKEGGLDETGIGINKVEKALNDVGIEMRTGQNDWKGMGDVLEETAQKWSTLTANEKSNIAAGIAGIRQKETFLVLMQNMSMAIGYQAAQMNSLGLSEERYAIYMDSIEGKMNKLNSTIEAIKMKFVDGAILKTILDWANATADFVNNIGGLVPVLGIILGLLLTIKSTVLASGIYSGIMAIVGFFDIAAAAATGLNAALMASGPAAAGTLVMSGPPGWIIGAIIAIGLGVIAITSYFAAQNAEIAKQEQLIKNAQKAVEDYNEKVNQLTNPDRQKQAEDLFLKIDELRQKGDKGLLTPEDAKNLSDYNKAIGELDKDAPIVFDEKTGYWILEAGYALEQYNENMEKTIALTDADVANFTIAWNTKIREWAKAKEELNAKKEVFNFAKSGALDELSDPYALFQSMKFSSDSTEAEKKLSEELRKVYQDALASASNDGKTISEANESAKKVLKSYILGMSRQIEQDEENLNILEKAILAFYNNLSDSVKPKIAAILAALGWGAWIEAARAEQDAIDAEAARLAGQIEGSLDFDYGKNVRAIDEISKSYQNLVDTVLNSDSTFADSSKAVEEFVDLLNNMIVPQGTVKKSFSEFVHGGKIDMKALADYKNFIYDNAKATKDWSTADEQQLAVLDQMMNRMVEFNFLGQSLTESQYTSVTENATKAMWDAISQTEQGMITVNGITITNANQLLNVLTTVPGAFFQIVAAMQQIGLQQTGQFSQSVIQNAMDTANELAFITPLSPIGVPTMSGGGGGGGKTEEQKRIEAEINLLNKKKEDIQQELEKFREFIDARKEALKLQKEESDFIDKIAKKNKDLTKVRTNLLLLSLDDSEEAGAKRLELEQEQSDLTEEIETDKNDRIYELQVAALDKQMALMEKATERQLAAIDAQIAKLQELNQAGGGGGGGGAKKSLEQMKIEAVALYDQLTKAKEELDKLMSVSQTGIEDDGSSDEGMNKAEDPRFVGNQQAIQTAAANVVTLTASYLESLKTMSSETRAEVEKVTKSDEEELKKWQSSAMTVFLNTVENFKTTMPAAIKGVGEVAEATNDTIETTNLALDAQAISLQKVHDIASDADLSMTTNLTAVRDILGAQKDSVLSAVLKIETSLGNALTKLLSFSNYWNALSNKTITLTVIHVGNTTTFAPKVRKPGEGGDVTTLTEHFGGLAYHNGGMTPTPSDSGGYTMGGLRSNEVFAKLLKGEYVATEGQMNSFLKNTLPSLINNYSSDMISSMSGNTNISIPVTVNGSMDSATLSDLEKAMKSVVSDLNNSVRRRGYVRQTTISNI